MAGMVWEPGSRRGQSELIGIILLFALVLLVSLSVVVIGGNALSNVSADTTMASAETTMLELQSAMQSVSADGTDEGEIAFAKRSGASAASDGASGVEGGTGAVWVDETAGQITVTVTDASEGTTESMTEPLGAIVYEQDQGRLVYQGGGVFRQSADAAGSTIASPPPIEYQYRGGTPTLSLPITQVTVPGPETSASVGHDLQLSGAGARVQHLPTASLSNPLDTGDTVTLTIESEYYEA